jgi:very-short-patch-repair endonuclease
MLSSITSGNTKTCGSCRETVYNWYIKNYNILQLMKSPITTNMIPQGGVIFLNTITNTGLPTPALCPACGSKYNPRFSDVKRGRSLTCGCVNNRISSINYEISDFIKSIGFKTILEYKLGKYSYDIFIENTKILIEYDGEKWHSSNYSTNLDLRKSKFAIDHGYQLLRIKETDWKIESTKIKNQIMKGLQHVSTVR